MLFVETSAKTADHVEQAFLDTATQIYNKVERGEIDITSEVSFFHQAYGVKPGNISMSSKTNTNKAQGLKKGPAGKENKKDSGCC